MMPSECTREATVLAALGGGFMPEELEAHVRSCPVCQDAKLVWDYLANCAASEAETEIAPAGVIWWRAQLANKRAAAERSVASISIMQKISLVIAAITAVAIGAWQGPRVVAIPPMLLAGSAAVLILFVASLLVVFRLERDALGPRGM